MAEEAEVNSLELASVEEIVELEVNGDGSCKHTNNSSTENLLQVAESAAVSTEMSVAQAEVDVDSVAQVPSTPTLAEQINSEQESDSVDEQSGEKQDGQTIMIRSECTAEQNAVLTEIAHIGESHSEMRITTVESKTEEVIECSEVIYGNNDDVSAESKDCNIPHPCPGPPPPPGLTMMTTPTSEDIDGSHDVSENEQMHSNAAGDKEVSSAELKQEQGEVLEKDENKQCEPDTTSNVQEDQKSEVNKKRKSSKKKKRTKSHKIEETNKNVKQSVHVQGGFSSGWVGPMLQLVASMKKIDEFKSCHEKLFPQIPSTQSTAAPKPLFKTTSQENMRRVEGKSPMREALIQAAPGDGCPRCGGVVFEAEKMQSRFRKYHRRCFNCKACNTTLDSTKACDGPDKDVYCKLCYSKKYGPKGYGFGCGAAFLQSDVIRNENDSRPAWTVTNTTSIKAAPGQGCPRCGGVVFAAEQMLSKGREWHKSCFNCRDCKRPLDSTIACDGPDNELYCKLDYAKRFGLKGFGYGHVPTLVSGSADQQTTNEAALQQCKGIKADPGKGCPRCGYIVYAAERKPVKDRVYHKKCFNCKECHRRLDSVNACDGPDEEVYCRTCYFKHFGPKGVGYGIGAGVLNMG